VIVCQNKQLETDLIRAMMRDRKRRCVDGRLSENKMKNRMHFNRREIGCEYDKGKI